jgi:peptidoglycan/LPS O-acetylase OafA/YrhL
LSVERFLKESGDHAARVQEDCRWLADNRRGLQPLIDDPRAACSAYVAATGAAVDQLAQITYRLRRLTREPGSWTLSGFSEATASYWAAKEDAQRKGGEMSALFDKLKPALPSGPGHQLFYRFSVLYGGTAGFYIVLLALCLSGGLRDRFQAVFSLPAPANQSVIKPFDAVRGLSALWVALYHIDEVFNGLNVNPPLGVHLHGERAVPVFATISAFLIFRSVRKVTSWPELFAYLKRRWLKIYPIYCATALVILYGGYHLGASHLGWKDMAGELSMAPVFGLSASHNPPTWSLFIEERFYLLIPLWLLCFRRQVPLAAVVSYLVFSTSIGHYAPERSADLPRFFFVGILLTAIVERPLRLPEAAKWLVLLAGAALYWGSVSFESSCPPSVWRHLFPLAILCALWAAVNIPIVHRALSVYPLRFLGIVSYSMYLSHYILYLTGMPLVFGGYTGFPLPATRHTLLEFWLIYPAAVVFYSACAYALIERPFLLLRKKTVVLPAASLRLDAQSAT